MNTTPAHARPGNTRPVGALRGDRRKLAREIQPYAAMIIDMLLGLINDKATPPAVVVSACREILDRGFGRPYVASEPAECEGVDSNILDDPDPDV